MRTLRRHLAYLLASFAIPSAGAVADDPTKDKAVRYLDQGWTAVDQ